MNKPITWVLLFVAGYSVAQTSPPEFEPNVFQVDNFQLNYQILYPEGFSPKASYPVLLFLHGAGERGSDNQKQLTHGSELFLNADFRIKHPAIVLFPQCPEDSYWANVQVDRSSWPLKFDFDAGGEPTVALSAVMALMDSIQSLPFTKDSQVYAGGLSMGGMGTFELISRKPSMFAAAFAICGGAHLDRAKVIAENVPMWIFHGAQDNVVPPSFSTDMVIAIRKAGGEAKYTLYKEANHNSWDSAFREPGLMEWLFAKSKE
ncbi:dienelactone hydrolase family protein [Marinoscillum sp.]|uniref:carboxylesterase family protein n=1 Tax=Marinoscillum sp. TaxID=2024838 RepID=UPI003BABA710